MKNELSKYLSIPVEHIEKLMRLGIIDPRTANAYVIFKEYKFLRKQNQAVSDRVIHVELATKHGVSPSAIYKWCQMFS